MNEPMNIHVYEQIEELYHDASKRIIEHIQKHPETTLGLATGSTPLGVYQRFIHAYQQGFVSFKKVLSFNLDEYVGLDRHHPQSYYTFMHQHLFSSIDIPSSHIHIPNGMATDLVVESKHYDTKLSKHRIDIQLLGLGTNGHIGFNEPGTPFTSTTHVIELKESTRKDNARFFKSFHEVPQRAITMGIYSIMQAKEIVLIATGEHKAQAVFDMIKGPIHLACPASILQTHTNVHLYLDYAAAKAL